MPEQDAAEFVVSCLDPERCASCPPDRVCAWACQQGWSAVETARFLEFLQTRSEQPGGLPDMPAGDCLAEALWDSFN